MSTDRVRAHLSAFGMTDEIIEFADSSATVELAAARLGTDPQHIAKTLGFYNPDDEAGSILVVVAGDAKVNSGKFKRAFGAKPRMLSAADVPALAGHPVGGVCPFANPQGARVYLDESLRRFTTVYPAAGSPNSAIPVSLDQLERLSGSLGWVDVSVGWQDE